MLYSSQEYVSCCPSRINLTFVSVFIKIKTSIYSPSRVCRLATRQPTNVQGDFWHDLLFFLQRICEFAEVLALDDGFQGHSTAVLAFLP